MSLTVEQKVKIVQWYYQGNTFDDIINNLFIVAFEGDPPPTAWAARHIVKNFNKYGCVTISDHKPFNPKPKNDDLETLICLAAEENPDHSSYAIAKTLNVNQSRVWSVLKKYNYARPYRHVKSTKLPTKKV